MSRMQVKYKEEVAPALMSKFAYKSPMQIPRLEKVVINIGLGEAKDNPKAIEAACGDLAKITGQKPVVTKAKKSVANFKLRQGMNIGCKVTLRSAALLDRFSASCLPCSENLNDVTSSLGYLPASCIIYLSVNAASA